ncbi:MAG: TSUP family transporter [Myxococcales bacterium]|nr:TSUP family transporter [Myxococcales bacterium]
MLLVQVIVSVCFLLVFFSVSLILWFKAPASIDSSIKPGPLSRIRIQPTVNLPIAEFFNVSAPLTCYIGLGLGTLSGLLGIGGGVVLMPTMLYGFGFNIRKAAGTGIAVILVVAVIGTLQHARLANVHCARRSSGRGERRHSVI